MSARSQAAVRGLPTHFLNLLTSETFTAPLPLRSPEQNRLRNAPSSEVVAPLTTVPPAGSARFAATAVGAVATASQSVTAWSLASLQTTSSRPSPSKSPPPAKPPRPCALGSGGAAHTPPARRAP